MQCYPPPATFSEPGEGGHLVRSQGHLASVLILQLLEPGELGPKASSL